jgi:predicted nuclease of predicted toxin-antitoxin system
MPGVCRRSRTKAIRRTGGKLLLDENLSDRIVSEIADLFPASLHVKEAGPFRADDRTIAEWAAQNDFTIVSKDSDFYRRSVVLGQPAKFIWLGIGNCATAQVVDLLRRQQKVIEEFSLRSEESVLVLGRGLGI